MNACDAVRKMGVRANADLPADAKLAFRFGAEGIGLCRTEHMFFAEERLPYLTELILSAAEARRSLLARREKGQAIPPWHRAGADPDDRAIQAYFRSLRALKELQADDFYGLFQAVQGRPVTIRTLDPPLHEFLPSQLEIVQAIADLRVESLSSVRRKEIANLLRRGDASGWLKGSDLERLQQLLQVVQGLAEFNPMLGHRGCRLGIVFPEVTQMQARAMFEAAARCLKEGFHVDLEIMIPLVGMIGELEQQARVIDTVFTQVKEETKVNGLSYRIGSMLEVPRAALIADKLAAKGHFFSFGTNDLTQMTLGYSRDDAGKFIPAYLEQGILKVDPFVSLDIEGVGQLVAMACNRARAARPDIMLGICGEHADKRRSPCKHA
jgi:pyruvate,orthophosphate dikinase